jgi:hypothetical protein
MTDVPFAALNGDTERCCTCSVLLLICVLKFRTKRRSIFGSTMSSEKPFGSRRAAMSTLA